MSAFRFVHVADVHLDAPFGNRDAETRALLARSLRDSFDAAVALAIDEKVHAFLIAGDLFHRPDPSLAAEAFLLGRMRRLVEAGFAVFYAAGNHDPGLAARRGRRVEWPAGVVYFADGNPIRTDVRGAGGETIAWVTGAGHEGPAVPDNLAARFPRVSGSLPEIALLHASVEGSANLVAHDRYAPCSKGDLEGKGYDYWALGHVHRREALLASPPAHYPGSVLGLDRTETGEKGALLVEVRRGEEPRVLFRPTAPVAWREMDIDAAKIGSVESLRQIIAEKMRYETIGSGALLVARLRGASPLADSLGGEEERSRLESEFKDELGLAYLSLRTEDLRRAIDVGKARVGPIAAALDLAASLRDGKEPFDAILRSDLAASVAGEARESPERLRRLLEGADEEIVFRMWRERS